ncbi:putative RNA polymerase II transcriptional coactivator [Ceratocystis fimbriata CBS 114723]|nr:putative RNA polymerase II transcriptional coactivator [Ceratocystis fimbriata CBS 114723]
MPKWVSKKGDRKRPASRVDGSDDEGSSGFQKKTKPNAEVAGDEESWALSGKRKITLSEFKGATYVNIREYYDKDGVELPGKKGISLNLEQYRTLMATIPKINNALLSKGITLPLYESPTASPSKVKTHKDVDVNDGKADKEEEKEEEE